MNFENILSIIILNFGVALSSIKLNLDAKPDQQTSMEFYTLASKSEYKAGLEADMYTTDNPKKNCIDEKSCMFGVAWLENVTHFTTIVYSVIPPEFPFSVTFETVVHSFDIQETPTMSIKCKKDVTIQDFLAVLIHRNASCKNITEKPSKFTETNLRFVYSSKSDLYSDCLNQFTNVTFNESSFPKLNGHYVAPSQFTKGSSFLPDFTNITEWHSPNRVIYMSGRFTDWGKCGTHNLKISTKQQQNGAHSSGKIIILVVSFFCIVTVSLGIFVFLKNEGAKSIVSK